MLDVTSASRGTASRSAPRHAPHEPGDIVIASPWRTRRRSRSSPTVNDDVLAGVTLGEVEEIWYTSNDGLRIQGWIVKPPDFDPRRSTR